MSRVWAVGVLVSTFVFVAFTNAAAAHTGAPVFDVREASAQRGTVRLQIGVTYSLDGDAAEAAFLTAVPVAPDGRARAAIDMTRRPNGVYLLEMEADSVGRWTFQITSRFPAGSTEVQVDVIETARATRPSARSRPDDGDRPAWILPSAVGGALLIGLAAAAIRRQRRRSR